jgi:hypothetical protein
MIFRLTTGHERGCAALSRGERAVFPAWAVVRERVVRRQIPAVPRLVGILPWELVQEIGGIAVSF